MKLLFIRKVIHFVRYDTKTGIALKNILEKYTTSIVVY